MKVYIFLICILVTVSIASAQMRVAVGGDSITVGWAGSVDWAGSIDRFQTRFDLIDYTVDVSWHATGGLGTKEFLGLSKNSDGVYRDYVSEIIATDPDLVILKLGTNDSYSWADSGVGYYERMTTIVSSFQSYINRRGVPPKVVLLTVLPPYPEASNDPVKVANAQIRSQIIANEINPFLRNYGIEYFDTESFMLSFDNWHEFYPYNDPWHPWGPSWADPDTFYNRMADYVRDNAIELMEMPGDANYDRKVDVSDLGILAFNYGNISVEWFEADFTGDGNVDVGDLGVLAANYGVVMIPEPSIVFVISFGILFQKNNKICYER